MTEKIDLDAFISDAGAAAFVADDDLLMQPIDGFLAMLNNYVDPEVIFQSGEFEGVQPEAVTRVHLAAKELAGALVEGGHLTRNANYAGSGSMQSAQRVQRQPAQRK